MMKEFLFGMMVIIVIAAASFAMIPVQKKALTLIEQMAHNGK